MYVQEKLLNLRYISSEIFTAKVSDTWYHHSNYSWKNWDIVSVWEEIQVLQERCVSWNSFDKDETATNWSCVNLWSWYREESSNQQDSGTVSFQELRSKEFRLTLCSGCLNIWEGLLRVILFNGGKCHLVTHESAFILASPELLPMLWFDIYLPHPLLILYVKHRILINQMCSILNIMCLLGIALQRAETR